ncbi:MAG TPA: hypothetical protein VJ921_01290 [Vicinamibacteria bacterium]|nr:hypothetical protein [Vicinamibacteria bacterium]
MEILAVLLVLAQDAPGVSGTWKLDPAQSRVVNEIGWPGLIGAGAPERIHVTQAANGTLVIESEINEGHSRIYKPGGGDTATPVAQTGRITMSSRWEGRTLVAEGTLVSPSGDSSKARETITLTQDGLTLRVEISTGGPASALRYTRTASVEPCEKWSTPCKPPGK